MIRTVCLIALLGLTACSSGGPGAVTGALIERFRGGGDDTASGPSKADAITRAEVAASGLAMLRVQETLEPRRGLIVAFRPGLGNVVWTGDGRRMVMTGGLIQLTYGYGDNLEGVRPGPNDPVAFPRPLARWPASYTRGYVLSDRGPGTETAVTCRPRPGPESTLDILGQQVAVQQVVERCRSADGDVAFVNAHFIDAKGAIWQSAQWTGPRQGTLAYEVLEPLD